MRYNSKISKINKKNVLFFIILVIVFSITSILALLVVKKSTSVHVYSDNNPDFFMTNAVYVKFDQNGNISNQFHTTKISHFAANNNYFFDEPCMKIYNASKQPWDISAKKGKSEQGKSKIYLWDAVRMVQVNNLASPEFDITTNSLTVYFDTKSAETAEPLTIIRNGSIAKAIGAKANFNLGIVELLSNVACEYR